MLVPFGESLIAVSAAARRPESGFTRTFCPVPVTTRTRSTTGLKSIDTSRLVLPAIVNPAPTFVSAPVARFTV